MDGSEKLVIACVTAPLLLHGLQNLLKLNYELKVPVRKAFDLLETISTRLRDAEKIPTNLDMDYMIWEEFLEELNHLEDVIIDGFLGRIKPQRRNDSLKIMSPLICMRPQVRIDPIRKKLTMTPLICYRHRFRTDPTSKTLDSFTTSAKKVLTLLEILGPTPGGTTSSTQPMQTRNLDYPMPDDSDFVGLNDKVDEVVKLLCYGKMPNYTIVVTGEAGSGKTFLTRTVYNATDVKRHFHGRAWVNFSEYFEARDFLLNILTQLTWWDWEFLDENLSQDEMKLKLQNFSNMNRCLIVVDDVRTVEGFYRLYNECGLSSKGIWLILTISERYEELASHKVKPHFCNLIRLRSLTDEESWSLFCKKARIAEEEEINLKEKNILRNCGGSPLKILIMEGLLSTMKWPSSDIELKIQKDILNLCYQGLSSQMKVCFLYFGLFPSGFEIPVRRLFHLWVAERLFITLLEGNLTREDLAEKCLKLLIRRNLIEVTKVRLDGSPKTCRMPITIWDVFSQRATALFLRESNIRGLTDYLRSYASFNRTPKSVNKFLDALVTPRGFGLLVVLDLENVYKPDLLSETLGKLLHLKHLGLRRTFLDSLPRSVVNLSFLETLDVKHTNITTLPSSIWKAKNLQHLYLNENDFDMFFEKPYIRSELQTLSGLFTGNKSVAKSYLYTLLRLRKLKLTFSSKLVEGIGDWISKLNDLRSLKLRSIDEFNRPATLELGSLITHHKLLELYLVGPLTRSIESPYPPNLKVLTLSASKLEKDPMPILGKLPHLNCLRLFRNSYLGKDMTCQAGEFPQLRVLKLWMLEHLEEWAVIKGTMPLLRELEIRFCPKLKLPEKLPLTLKDVVLINMPDGFVEYAERVLVNSFVKKITLPFAALLE